jgi:hypothetical protein
MSSQLNLTNSQLLSRLSLAVTNFIFHAKRQRSRHTLCMPPLTPSSPRLDNTSIDELHDLVPHRRVLHVILQRLRIGLRLLQNTLHNRIGHDFLSSSQTVSTPSAQRHRTYGRTATSGSRIARSNVSCSVSFARCALIALCILNESSWISRTLFDPAASSFSLATSSVSSAFVYSRSANSTLALRMCALTIAI